MNKLFLSLLFLTGLSATAWAQPDRWQQRVKYTMSVDVDVNQQPVHRNSKA
jgi:hypothetical protein